MFELPDHILSHHRFRMYTVQAGLQLGILHNEFDAS